MTASGGQVLPFSQSELETLFSYLKCRLYRVYDPTLEIEFNKYMSPKLGLTSLSTLSDNGLKNFLTIRPNQQNRVIFWSPVVAPGFWDKVETLRQSGNPNADYWGLLRKNLLGGFLFFLDQKDMTMDTAFRCLQRNYSRNGIALGIVPLKGKIKPEWLSEEFISNPEFPSHLRRDSGSSPDRESISKWEFLEGILLRDQEYRLILAQPASSGVTATPRQKLILQATVLWFLLGISCWIWFTFMHRSNRISLRWQLSGAFALIVFPSLILVFFTQERSKLETTIRLLSDSREHLENYLATIDESRSLFLGYEVSLVDSFLRNKKLTNFLYSLESMSDQERVSKSTALNLRLRYLGSRLGITLEDLLMVGPKKLASTRNSERIRMFYSFSLKTVLKALNPNFVAGESRANSNADIVFGGALEEVEILLRLVMTPEDIANMILAPVSFGELNSYDGLATFFTRTIWCRGFPRYAFHLKIEQEAIDYQQLLFWNGERERWKVSNSQHPWFQPAYIDSLHFPMMPPYLNPSWREGYYYKFKNLPLPSNPLMDDLPTLAKSTEVVAAALHGENEDRTLALSIRGRASPNMMFSGFLPVGRILQAAEMVVEKRQRTLLWLFFVSLILAQYASRRFLRPVLRLSEESGKVLQGIFTGRLEEDRGGEFGSLARAFNLMIAGVAEGKLLSKFVSESVRFAAADREKGAAARKGEVIDVTVMFAGIADFKSLTAQMPPEKLVIHLNHFLEAMSQIIRKNGGDIDKFIGEKILAVFHPSRLGGKEAAMNAGLEAGAAMRKRMSELQNEVPRPLGVGIVSGSVLAGIMGTPEVRLEYTVIGDTVNLSSRLGDLALRLGADGAVLPDYHGSVGGVVVEEATCAALRKTDTGTLYRMMKKLSVPPIKGKKRSVDASYLAT